MPAPIVPLPATPTVRISDIQFLYEKRFAIERTHEIYKSRSYETFGFVSRLARALRLRLSNETSADQLAMNLIRSFPDLRNLRVPHQPLHAIVLAISISAIELHRIGRNAHGEI